MKLRDRTLSTLVEELRGRKELDLKRDIQLPARVLGGAAECAWLSGDLVRNGDDTAAIPAPGGDGYVLFAAEGMRPEFVANDPWFAGFCSVMVNVSDVAAMGGRPWAVVDVLFLGAGENERVLEGMATACEAFGVPVVGGHTTRVTGNTALAVAVLGHAKRLISAHAARPGDAVLIAMDLRGSFRGPGGNWNAATSASARQLRANLAVLPELAEEGLVGAGKDISMAGTCGTVAMLLETSGVGARIDLGRIPAPPDVDPLRWLTAFPSFGFVLTCDPSVAHAVAARFDRVGVACRAVGSITDTSTLVLEHDGAEAVYFDRAAAPLTGFGA